MKRFTLMIMAACFQVLMVFVLSGCNDQIEPNKALIDSMNKQRGAMNKNLPNGGAPNTHAMTPDQATGNAPAPHGP